MCEATSLFSDDTTFRMQFLLSCCQIPRLMLTVEKTGDSLVEIGIKTNQTHPKMIGRKNGVESKNQYL